MKRFGTKEALFVALGMVTGGVVGCQSNATPTPTERPAAVATPTENFLATLVAQNQQLLNRLNTPNAAPATRAAVRPVNPNVATATASAIAPAVRPANLSSPEGRAAAMRTAQEVYNLIYQPCKTEIVGCYDLQVSEITPEKSAEGRIVGWRVARERNGQNFIPPFFVRLPEELGMQFGFMNLKSDREALGLTASEVNMLGYKANHVGSGLPSGELLPVEGLTIYFDQSADLAKLVNQTGPQRRIKRQ